MTHERIGPMRKEMSTKARIRRTRKSKQSPWVEIQKGYPHVIFRVSYEGEVPAYVRSVWASDGQVWERSDTSGERVPARIQYGVMRLTAFFAILDMRWSENPTAQTTVRSISKETVNRITRYAMDARICTEGFARDVLCLRCFFCSVEQMAKIDGDRRGGITACHPFLDRFYEVKKKTGEAVYEPSARTPYRQRHARSIFIRDSELDDDAFDELRESWRIQLHDIVDPAELKRLVDVFSEKSYRKGGPGGRGKRRPPADTPLHPGARVEVRSGSTNRPTSARTDGQPWIVPYLEWAKSAWLCQQPDNYMHLQVASWKSDQDPKDCPIPPRADPPRTPGADGARDAAEALRHSGHPIVLLGDPGSGKTSALQARFQELRQAADESVDAPLPVFIDLTGTEPPIASLVLASIGPKLGRGPVSLDGIKRRLTLLFDGLDRCSPRALPAQLTREILGIAKETLVHQVILSCTTSHWSNAYLGNIEAAVYSIQPLDTDNLTAIEVYARKRIPKDADLLLSLIRCSDTHMASVVNSPLFLSLVCDDFPSLHSVGTGRIVRSQVVQSWIARQLADQGHAGWYQELGSALLTEVARVMVERETLSIDVDALRHAVKIPGTGFQEALDNAVKARILRSSAHPGRSERIEFNHQILRDWFASRYLISLLTSENWYCDLCQWLEHCRRDEILLMALEQTKEEHVVARSIRVTASMSFDLALRAVAASNAVPDDVVRELYSWLPWTLLASDRFRQGVYLRILCQIGSAASLPESTRLFGIMTHEHEDLEYWIGRPHVASDKLRRILEHLIQYASPKRSLVAKACLLSSGLSQERCLECVSDREHPLRRSAIEGLSKCRNQEATDALLKVMCDNQRDADTRQSAASALAGMGNESAIDKVVATFDDPNLDPDIRLAMVLACENTNPEHTSKWKMAHLPILVAKVASSDNRLLISREEIPLVWPHLLGLFLDDKTDAATRRHIGLRFCNCSLDELCCVSYDSDTLIGRLIDEDPLVKGVCVRLLGAMKCAAAVKPLAELRGKLKAPPELLEDIDEALANIDIKAFVDVLLTFMRKGDRYLPRLRVLFPLLDMAGPFIKGEDVGVFFQWLPFAADTERYSWARALILGVDNSPRARELAITCLKKNPAVRRRFFADILERFPSPVALQYVRSQLRQKASCREKARLIALLRYGSDGEDIDYLLRVLREGTEPLSTAAAETLGYLLDAKTLWSLIDDFRRKQKGMSTDKKRVWLTAIGGAAERCLTPNDQRSLILDLWEQAPQARPALHTILIKGYEAANNRRSPTRILGSQATAESPTGSLGSPHKQQDHDDDHAQEYERLGFVPSQE